MAPTKRTRAQTAATGTKRAKIVDPVAAKIEAISSVLSEPECQVPGPDSHREMLLASIPHSLTVPKEERHKFQVAAVEMVGTVLSGWVADWEAKLAIDQTKVGSAEHDADASMKTLDECVKQIEVQEAEALRCKDVVQADLEAQEGAQEAFGVATKEVEDFDENLKNTVEQKDHCSSIYNECFVLLKNESVEAKEAQRQLKMMEPLLKKLGTESSLLSALAPSLKKSPADRGPFDNMAIDGVDEVFKKNLGELQEQIDKADILKAEKVASKEVSQAALDASISKRTTSEGALKEAEETLTALEVRRTDLYEAATVASTSAHNALVQQAITEGSLGNSKQVFSDFTELLERQTPTLLPADVEMSKIEEAPELCLMESVTA